jgi:hypothetical protein
MKTTHQLLTASMLVLTCALFGTFAVASDIHAILGQSCGGDDPRTQAICDCIADQMEEHLSEEQLEQIARHHEMEQAGEEASRDPEDFDMGALMALSARMQEIDFMQCAGAMGQLHD